MTANEALDVLYTMQDSLQLNLREVTALAFATRAIERDCEHPRRRLRDAFFCTNCGTRVRWKDFYCHMCGVKLEEKV